jgi:Flp pilus assembly protein TadG
MRLVSVVCQVDFRAGLQTHGRSSDYASGDGTVKKLSTKEGTIAMKLLNRIPILNRLINEDKGQALVFTSVILIGFMGLTGIAVDAGKGYYAYDLLRASTNAAALAGAAGLPNTSTATTYADNFGSEGTAYNSNGIMSNVNTAVSFECLTSVATNFYAMCEDSSGNGSSSGYNAIQVTQTAQVPTWIGPLFGMPTFNISDTATASMKGGTPTPYNIAIVLDTTSSMNGADNGAGAGLTCSTQITCAELGVQTFLQMLVPGGSSSPIDVVSLYVFPGATSASMSNDYACNGSSPSIVPYTFTSSTAGPTTSAMPSGDTYNVISWSNDYKTADSNDATLSTSSNLVKAVGGKSGCGATAPGGEGTYYAQVIYQAQADLAAEQLLNKNSNMMIILSDGDATACNPQTSTGDDCGSDKYQIEVSTCPTITTANDTKTTVISSSTPCLSPYSGLPINGTDATVSINSKNVSIQPSGYLSAAYPSALGLCGQAVQAAQYATSKGTKVYTIGYGSELTGCTTDTSYTTDGSASYGANSWPFTGKLTTYKGTTATTTAPCYALGAMASQPSMFFSDGVNGCVSTDATIADLTTLKQIFTHIGANLTTARLIPNNAS